MTTRNLPPHWREESNALVREFATGGWPVTLMLVNAIGFVAEAADHHPDLEVSWGRVRVRLSTHDAGGVTDKDVALAHEIERVALWRPPEGSPLAGTKSKFVRGA